MTITRDIRFEALEYGIVRHIVVPFCLFYLNLFGPLTKVHAILDWYELNNTCYGLASPATTLNFADSKSSCIIYNAVLTSVPSLEVHTFLTHHMDADTDYWVDLTLDPLTQEYIWSNGDSPVNSTWFPGEPNFSGDRVRYTRTIDLTILSKHRLADKYDIYNMSYICQRSAANVGDIGTGQEVTSSEESHYVTMDITSTNGRLRCASICLQTFGCGLIGYLASTSQCLLLRWAASNETLSVDPAFRFHTVQRRCDIP